MNSAIRTRIIDDGSLDYLLKELEDFEKNKLIRGGLSAAGDVFRAGGKSRLASRLKGTSQKGNLLRSLSVRVKRRKPGVLIGFGAGGAHAHLVDSGTKERAYKNKNGKAHRTGKVIGNKFWHDTKTSDYPKAMSALELRIVKAVERINQRR